MSFRKLDAYRHRRTFNIGDWLSAKIYSDSKEPCSCTGKFTAYKSEDGIDLPVCDKCGAYPPFFRIRAKVINEHLKVEYKDIRHTGNDKRITKFYECMTILDQVQRELDAGTFDVTRYGSKKSRDSFLFNRLANEYLLEFENSEKRGDTTPYGYKNKKKYIKVLLSHFTGMDVAKIDEVEIEKFRNSFTEKLRTRDLATGELRTFLKFCYKRKKIQRVPLFERIPSAKARKSVLKIEDARQYVPHIKEKQYRLICFLHTVYAWRPCETRAIQKKTCLTNIEKVRIERHFSGNKLIEGRKSIPEGEKATLEFDMILELKNWIEIECRNLGPDDFIFQRIPSKNRVKNSGGFTPVPGGLPLGETTLPKAWSRELKDLGVPHVEMYEIRHARGTEVSEQSNGNMLVTRDFMGHTNVQTTEKHYTFAKNLTGNFIDKNAEIIPFVREVV
jgi:integrase